MSIPDLSLKGKIAIVTGARRGIGRTIALAYAEAGADVAICSRSSADELQNVAREIRQHNVRSLAIQADVSKKTEVEALIQRTIAAFGRLDILVNNAGVPIRGKLIDLKEEDWDQGMGINLKGSFLCAQAAARKMVEQKRGIIINIASQLAFKSWPNLGAYCISKAGVVMLTRILARELGPMGIRVNAIAPALVKTDFSRGAWTDTEALKKAEAAVPYGGRISEPQDLVGAALFLASEASGYISGHTMLVDAATNA